VKGDAKPAKASCVAMSVDDAGVGTYRCIVDYDDDSRLSYQVTMGADGKWVSDSGTN
jgi:hypothetical protein